MHKTVARSQYNGWYIEAVFLPEFEYWEAHFFDQEESRLVNLSGSVGEAFSTDEEALAFARQNVDTKIQEIKKESKITERFSNLIDELLGEGHSPYRILRSIGNSINKKRNAFEFDTEKLREELYEAAFEAPGE